MDGAYRGATEAVALATEMSATLSHDDAELRMKPPLKGGVWVYLVTNKQTGRQYVGITTFAIRRRWLRHCNRAVANKKRNGDCPALHAAIRKYGEGGFQVHALMFCFTWDAAVDAEQAFIAELKTKVPRGYNLTDGGDGIPGRVTSDAERLRLQTMNLGRKHTPEFGEKIRARKLGTKASPETLAKLRGRQRTPEHCLRISAAKKGKKMSDQTRATMSASHMGLKPTAETRAKMSAWQVGRKFSDETRAKISASLRARSQQPL